MKKFFKIFFRSILVILVLVNGFILLTGRTYIYKGLMNTYFVGVSHPQIDEADIFANHAIPASQPQPWELHEDYNAVELNASEEANHQRLESAAYVIIKDNKLLFEKYWAEFNESSTTNSFSMAKSITSLLAGIALSERKIESIFDPVSKYLPAFAEGEKANITVKDILTMSSGLDWSESSGNPLSDNAQAYYGSDLRSHIEGLDVAEPSGKEFKYLSGNTQVLGYIVEAAMDTSLADLAYDRIWSKIGAETEALWNLDREGGDEKSFCCFYASARDFARIGQLILNQGMWNNERIINNDYLKLMVRPSGLPHHRIKGMQAPYGYQWWYDQYQGMDVHYARGVFGQYIIVIPAKQLVVVRTGRERDPVNERDHPADLYAWIDTALRIGG